MRRKSMVLRAVFVLACVVASSAFGQDDKLEVTMRVLDDVREIDGVFLSIDNELDSEVGDTQTTDRENGVDHNDSEEGAAEGEGGDDVGVDDGADFDTEDDEHAEGEIEDHDVEEEHAVDEPTEGAEEEA